MEMIDVLSKGTIDLTLPSFNCKDELFRHLTSMLKQSGCINDEEAFITALYEREGIGSTYMGEGIAIPHGKSEAVNHAAAAICKCSPFQYLSGDDAETVNLAIVLAIPRKAKVDTHIKMLSNLSRLLMNERFHSVLMSSGDVEEVLKVFKEEIIKLSPLN
jgi:fructose-specific phosphotransferase system IIA component